MAQVTKNSFKGYSYQEYVYVFMLAKMDAERNFLSLDAEVNVPHNMDDLQIIAEHEIYQLQIKNYEDLNFSEIIFSDSQVIIRGNTSILSDEVNIFIFNGCIELPINDDFYGLPAYKKSRNIYCISLTTDYIEEAFFQLYSNSRRASQIFHLGAKKCSSKDFSIHVGDLPEFAMFSTALEQSTVLVRERLKGMKPGVLCVIGKPGIGKSHFATELLHENPYAHLYRFWVSAHDKEISNRLQFDNFLTDLALKILKIPKAIGYEELIAKINELCPLIIIDGLDHVENNNNRELEKYFEFINAISQAKVIVLTRPLSHPIYWEQIQLDSWTGAETRKYLEIRHNITDYKIVKNIYRVTHGYPIIVFYLASHYEKYGHLNITSEIAEINEYYDQLLSDTKVKSLLAIFLISTSYFTNKEFADLIGEMSVPLIEFIHEFPYLFDINIDRVSLIHDSFNTYLRQKGEWQFDYLSKIKDKIKQSISNGEIRYLARLGHFNFDNQFIISTIKKYSNFDKFVSLIRKTIDWESVIEFYAQLKILLEYRPEILNIYEYYSFILIQQIVERNDFIGSEALVYQQIQYYKRQGLIPDQIHSNGILWSVYLVLNQVNTTKYRKHLDDKLYDAHSAYSELLDIVEEEKGYFAFLSKEIDINKVEKYLKANNNLDILDVLCNLMIYCYVKNIDHKEYNLLVQKLVAGDMNVQNEICLLAINYGVDSIFARNFAQKILHKLKTMGILKNQNQYYDLTLDELISQNVSEGSFEVYSECLDYLRLANYDKRNIDIENLWKYFFMYYQRKDYSVFTLPQALNCFESYGFLNSKESIKIIENAMNKSEKGIRHLLCEYIEINGIENMPLSSELERYIMNGHLFIFDLPADMINTIEPSIVRKEWLELVGRSTRTSIISFHDIENLIFSKYGDAIIDCLAQYNIKLIDVPRCYEEKFSSIDSMFISEEPPAEYIPFHNSNIHTEDIPYIIENKIDCVEVSKYTDGWYSCFSILEIYNHYDENILQENLCKIIHASMYAKIVSIERIGNWNHYLGNLPCFINQIHMPDIDWPALYETFRLFLRISQIID